MDKAKRKRLERQGWKVGSAEEFLGLSPIEAQIVGLRVALSTYLRQARKEKSLTQVQLAGLLKSSQSRVAKMEVGDPSVTIDLLVSSLYHLGATNAELSRVIRRSTRADR